MGTYNPKKVSLAFLGQRITGFVDGTFIKAARNQPSYSLTIGADGEPCYVANPDKSGTIKVTLQMRSAGNDILSAALARDELADANTGTAFMKDASGRTLVSGDNCRVEGYAEVELSNEKTAREWTILVPELKMLVGGN